MPKRGGGDVGGKRYVGGGKKLPLLFLFLPFKIYLWNNI